MPPSGATTSGQAAAISACGGLSGRLHLARQHVGVDDRDAARGEQARHGRFARSRCSPVSPTSLNARQRDCYPTMLPYDAAMTRVPDVEEAVFIAEARDARQICPWRARRRSRSPGARTSASRRCSTGWRAARVWRARRRRPGGRAGLVMFALRFDGRARRPRAVRGRAAPDRPARVRLRQGVAGRAPRLAAADRRLHAHAPRAGAVRDPDRRPPRASRTRSGSSTNGWGPRTCPPRSCSRRSTSCPPARAACCASARALRSGGGRRSAGPLMVSGETGEGVDALWAAIFAAIRRRRRRRPNLRRERRALSVGGDSGHGGQQAPPGVRRRADAARPIWTP